MLLERIEVQAEAATEQLRLLWDDCDVAAQGVEVEFASVEAVVEDMTRREDTAQ